MPEALEEGAQPVPGSIATISAWGTVLSVGGLLSVVGTLGYSYVQMRQYEETIAVLQSGVAGAEPTELAEAVSVDEAPVEEPVAPATTSAAATGEPSVQVPPATVRTDAASERRAAELEAQLAQVQDALGAARRELVDAKATIDALTARVQACGEQVGGRNNQLQESARTNERLAQQVSALSAQNERLARENSALTQRAAVLARENDALTRRNNGLSQENARLAELNRRLTQENRNLAQACPPNPRAVVP